jgi:prepilin-type N-terminal cleavage/methylation domain-containing protein
MHRRTRTNSARIRRASGFTLIEVLLTLLIMGMLMLSMTQILTAARYSRDTIHNIQETQLAGPAIMDLIERDVRGLFTFNRARAEHLRVVDRVMLGLDSDSLDFITTTDSKVLFEIDNRFIRADINEVGYRLRPSPESDEFLEIYRREDFGVDEEPFEGGRYVFLHDRVKSFEIQIYMADGLDDNEPLDEWGVDERSPEIGIPARVEISMTLELRPRIMREQLRIVPLDRRTVTFRRVIRLPEALRAEEQDLVVPLIPLPGADPQSGGETGGGGGGGPDDPGGPGGPGGPGSQEDRDRFDELERQRGGNNVRAGGDGAVQTFGDN